MAISHGRSKRKKTGGAYHSYRSKRAYELGSELVEVKPGEKKVTRVRTRGGNFKIKAIRVKEANILNPKTKRYEKAEIISVKENKANPHFVRRNVITKGAIIETKIGLAKVTSRPGQEGVVNAILIKE